jgi:drug/metabolite transporter (DMT)-like permease
MARVPRDLNRTDYLIVALMSLFGCAGGMFLQYLGTTYTLASNVSFIVSFEPPLIALASVFFLKEALHPRTGHALFLGFVGMLLMSIDFSSVDIFASQYLRGNAIVFCSIISFTMYNMCGKAIANRLDPIEITIFILGSASIGFFAAMMLQEPSAIGELLAHFQGAMLPILYIAVFGTALAYLVWNWLLKWMSATELGLTLLLQPMFGTIFSYFLLGEELSPPAYLGAILILAALWWQTRPATYSSSNSN